MMKFSIGDKVVHPKFGPGEITGETDRELVAGFEQYYVIKVIRTGATAYIPKRNMTELGVRQVMSRKKIAQVLSILRSMPSVLSSDYKLRQAAVQEKLQTCRPSYVAEAVRDLAWHRKRKRLTQKDEDLLNRGRELLAGEMALATDTQIPDAHEAIDIMLLLAVARGQGVSDSSQADVAALEATSEFRIGQLLDRVGMEQDVPVST
jgi:CarD family transcriptional regulator